MNNFADNEYSESKQFPVKYKNRKRCHFSLKSFFPLVCRMLILHILRSEQVSRFNFLPSRSLSFTIVEVVANADVWALLFVWFFAEKYWKTIHFDISDWLRLFFSFDRNTKRLQLNIKISISNTWIYEFHTWNSFNWLNLEREGQNKCK